MLQQPPGRALRDDAPTLVAAFRAHVHDPVCIGNQIQVVLDHHHRVAGLHQAVQHADQLTDISHVQSDGRFIQNIERVP